MQREPSQVRDEYAPVIFAQETVGYLESIDMMSGEEDRENILRAWATGKAVLTSPFRLLGSHHLGVVLTFPVYKSKPPPNPTTEEVKKHIKQGQGHEGSIFTVEAPLHASNVQVIDPVTGRYPTGEERCIAYKLCEACDFQVIYASGIKGKAGFSPENLADDLGSLFESIMRCIPRPRIDKDGSLQMLVSNLYKIMNLNNKLYLLFVSRRHTIQELAIKLVELQICRVFLPSRLRFDLVSQFVVIKLSELKVKDLKTEA